MVTHLLIHFERFPTGGGGTVTGHGLCAILAGNIFAVIAQQGE